MPSDMSRIKTLFERKPSRILNVYCTAGFPTLDTTLTVMKALQDNGADMIELGMPYSDPLADGPVIQASSTRALKNGMTIRVLFDQLAEMRKSISIPVVLMGYMNPVLQYGFEKFCRNAAAVGIDGLILPDLPVFEFQSPYAAILKKYGLDFIFLVTPETSAERVRQLDASSSGFLYAVSSSATTGGNQVTADLQVYLRQLQSLDLKNPILVGFGINDKASFELASAGANGAIIGSAFINAIDKPGRIEDLTKNFLAAILH
jgi:tryptophan synthase alpha chain